MPPASPVDRRTRRTCRARARSPLATGGAAAVGALLVAASMLLACSLDWAVRSESGAASQPETGSDVIDAPMAKDDAETSVPTDAPLSPDAGDCAALLDTVTLKRKKARECDLAMGQCMSTVKDECGCDVVVKDAGSTQSADFKNAVDAFIAACGKPPCVAACPMNGLSPSWFCTNAGAENHCNP